MASTSIRAIALPLCIRRVHGVAIRRSSSMSKLPWRKEAEKIVGYPTSFLNLRYLLSDEISNVVGHLRKLVGTRHPLLKTARKLLDDEGGFQSRGVTVLLMSKALCNAASLNPAPTAAASPNGILPAQRHLSEITELMYMAELIHDNVVDVGHPATQTLYDTECLTPQQISELSDGNKMAVLLGDYLLANASAGLGKLYNVEVTRMMSQSLSDMKVAACLRLGWQVAPKDDLFGLSNSLFAGRSDHLTSPPADSESVAQAPEPLLNWMRWLGLSHGSLLAHGCRSMAELGGLPDDLQQRAWCYGWHLALADGIYNELQPNASALNPTLAVGFLRALCSDGETYQEATAEAERAQQYHAKAARDALATFPPSDALSALKRMAAELT